MLVIKTAWTESARDRKARTSGSLASVRGSTHRGSGRVSVPGGIRRGALFFISNEWGMLSLLESVGFASSEEEVFNQ
jgi:hypothetical protein